MVFQDRFGRVHDDLRVSITDRCNLRCGYCMPETPVWFPRGEIMSYEEILQLVRIMMRRGVSKIRITGGEPLVRRDLPSLIALLAAEPGLDEISLTTNGALLGGVAKELARAGLRRINVSLDTLRPDRYRELTRRAALTRVLRGIESAAAAGILPIKVNTVLMRGVNEDEVETMVGHARDHGWELRFIEFMPLANDGNWSLGKIVGGEEVRERIHRRWPIEPDGDGDPRAPATRYRFRDGKGTLGFVDSVTAPFCTSCSRLRLTSDGKFRVCIYDDREVDLKTPLRAGQSDEQLDRLMSEAVMGKGRGGALEIRERQISLPLDRTMHQIGG